MRKWGKVACNHFLSRSGFLHYLLEQFSFGHRSGIDPIKPQSLLSLIFASVTFNFAIFIFNQTLFLRFRLNAVRSIKKRDSMNYIALYASL